MKKNNILFAFLLAAANLCAQIQQPQEILISARDPTNGQLVPRRMIVARDGGFITAGSDGSKGYLTRTNNCGKVIWVRQYLLGDETDLNSVTELPSGDIVAVGACRNCVVADSTLKALVIKTDAGGQLLMDTSFGHANFNAQAFDVITTASGKAAVTGYVDFDGFLGPSNAILAVLNPALHAEVWKELNHFYRDAGNALAQTADGGFVIAGNAIPAFFAPFQAQLFRTDASGNLLWKNTSPHISSEFNDVQQATDGRIIALGDRMVDSLSGRDVFLAIHNDGSGSMQQEKLYGSPANDAGNSLERVQGGYLVGAVYGQPSQSDWNTRDWVFRLSESFDLVDQYFRDDYLYAHILVNAVPLSSDGKAFAYRARMVFFSSAYDLFFKRTFQGNLAVLTQAPAHYQLVPRNLTTNRGTVSFSGLVADAGTYDVMRLDVLRNDVLQTTLYDNSPQSFQFAPEINAELADYTFQLYGIKNQLQYPEAEACEVVAGDAYFIQGQSNAEAGLPFWDTANTIDHAYRHHTSAFIRNFGLKYNNDTLFTWHKETGQRNDYADNLSGQWGLVFGKKIVDTYGIPVAIINGAISGISIDSMMPDPFNHANPASRYGRFLRRVEHSGLKDHIRAKLMFQGETNAAGGFWDSADEYYQKFVAMDNAWKQDFPAVQSGYLFQIRPGAYFAGATLITCLQIEEALRRIAETLPEWQIMSTTGMNHDGTHYYYQNGYERAGHDIFRLLAHDLYGAPAVANIYPPTVESLRFSHCNRREIALQLRHENDTYLWTPGWESDFLLEGDAGVSVTSGQVIGNTVFLTLSNPPGPNFTGLSYTSHLEGSDAPVKNANGIGMLTFYNLSVGEYDPIVLQDSVITADNGSSNGSIGLTPMGGIPPYSYLWNTGSTTSIIEGLVFGTYLVTVADAHLCSQTFVFVVPLTIGTSAADSDLQAKIFPNPCAEYLHVQLPPTPEAIEYQIEITDMLGREVSQPLVPTGELTQIETNELPSGTYLMTLWQNGVRGWSGVFVRK
ncbi:MAG: T9SS type A sorting domain-containing protein [Phycisphaerae bacterium]|nr:T9SS type A sorting domain-containing protein [Saprospiraceae bacterium]